MSELKAFEVTGKALFGRFFTKKVYDKDEADKAIAEKDKEIQRLENLCESYRIDCDNLAIREANAYKEIERDNKQLRHHKYKRCLDKAELCRSEWAAAIFIHEKGGTDKQAALYMKWEKRWLALADKFKEANNA